MRRDLASRAARFFGAEGDAATGAPLRAAIVPVTIFVIAALLQRLLDIDRGLLVWLALVVAVALAWGAVAALVRAGRSRGDAP